jgi:hypothetical protein
MGHPGNFHMHQPQMGQSSQTPLQLQGLIGPQHHQQGLTPEATNQAVRIQTSRKQTLSLDPEFLDLEFLDPK